MKVQSPSTGSSCERIKGNMAHQVLSTQIAVCVPIDVGSEWLQGNRLRLAGVRKAVAEPL